MSLDAETTVLIQQDLYFGSKSLYSGEVSPEEFQAFVDDVITPRFPAGLTIFDAEGQFLDSKEWLIKNDTNVVSLFVEDSLQSEVAINEIVEIYNQQFPGVPVSQVTNEDELKVGFGVGENLIDNDLVPELIQVDLFFGRSIAGGGEVSQEEFQAFLDSVVTPRFPDGLTVFDTNGQFQDSTDLVIKEPSKVVSLILEDTETNEVALDEIVEAYTQQFQQESVLQAVNEDITVSFGPTDNLIENDPIPELIQTDLFFGRSIAGGGEVSQGEFQAFLDSVVTPLFPAGLTVFDTNGQFQDSTGSVIEEPSEVVSLILEDTETNEAAINKIVEAYIQQFQQESVLIVVDEDIQAEFTNEFARLSHTPDTLLGANEYTVQVGNFSGSDELEDSGFQARSLVTGDIVLGSEQYNLLICERTLDLQLAPYLQQSVELRLNNLPPTSGVEVDFASMYSSAEAIADLPTIVI